MKTNEIFFSPTGGTEKVVRIVAQAWEGEHQSIDISAPDSDYSAFTFARDEICIIGVPSFGGRVPAVAIERLHKMRADGTPTVIITAYGNRDYDDTLLELRDALKQNGFRIIAAIAAVTEHSMVRKYGAGRPNADDESTLRGFAEKIKQAPESGAELPEPAVKGNVPYKEFGGSPMKPKADKHCNGCGACARVCPMKAIPPESPSETDNSLCMVCMRCVAVCPRHARKLNPAMLLVLEQKLKKGCAAPKENELHMG